MKKDFAIVSFLLAGLLVVAVIIGIPLLHAMHLSLYRLESFISEPSWVGLDNYARIQYKADFLDNWYLHYLESNANLVLPQIYPCTLARRR